MGKQGEISGKTVFVLYAKYKSTKVQTLKNVDKSALFTVQNSSCTLVLFFFKKLSIYTIYFYNNFIKNRVQEYKNVKNSSKSLINQRFFLYSALYFAFYVKYKSTKTVTAAVSSA